MLLLLDSNKWHHREDGNFAIIAGKHMKSKRKVIRSDKMI
jgi:hypothetical protein